MPEQWLALIIVGLIAGVASGMFGIGGGVIIVPALTLLLGFDLKQAVGTSLGALLMPVSVFAVLAYHRAGKLKLSTAAWVAGGLAFGAYLGSQVALEMETRLLEQLYGVFLLYMAWRFAEPRKWWRDYRSAKNQPLPPAQDSSAAGINTSPPGPLSIHGEGEERRQGSGWAEAQAAHTTVGWYVLLVLGFVAGIASGMFGIGGGVVIVPALVALLNFDQKEAVGTSLAALLLPVSLLAVVEYYQDGKLAPGVAALVALGLVGGAFIGAKIALGLPSTTVKRLYGVFLLFVGLRFILQF